MAGQESSAKKQVNRREFVRESALAAVGLGLTAQLFAAEKSAKSILNYNEKMEYRRLGRTGLMVSACLPTLTRVITVILSGIPRTFRTASGS